MASNWHLHSTWFQLILSNVTWIQNLIVELFPSKDQVDWVKNSLLCVLPIFVTKIKSSKFVWIFVIWLKSDKARMSIFQFDILTQGTWPSSQKNHLKSKGVVHKGRHHFRGGEGLSDWEYLRTLGRGTRCIEQGFYADM